MEPNFLNKGCDLFMNESEIKMERRTKGERYEENLSSQLKKMITNLKTPLERLLTKKRFILNVDEISNFFGIQLLIKG